MTKRLRNRILLFSGLFLLSLVVGYGYALPTVIGRSYLHNLYGQVPTIGATLTRVADTGNMALFNDPDLSLTDRLSQAAAIKATLDSARDTLSDFKAHIDELPQLPATGWLTDYLTATVKRRDAERLVLQSREVFDEYEALLTFVSNYTALQRNLDDRVAMVEGLNDVESLAGRGAAMTAIAAQIRDDADVLKGMAAPPDLRQLQQEALKTFDQAARGFDDLAAGLNDAIGSEIVNAANEVVAASQKNKNDDKDLLVTLANTSPIFARLFELPEKTDYVEQ
jgi:hypothetical protein